MGACGRGQTARQTRVTNIHFVSSTNHAKCNKVTVITTRRNWMRAVRWINKRLCLRLQERFTEQMKHHSWYLHKLFPLYQNYNTKIYAVHTRICKQNTSRFAYVTKLYIIFTFTVSQKQQGRRYVRIKWNSLLHREGLCTRWAKNHISSLTLSRGSMLK